MECRSGLESGGGGGGILNIEYLPEKCTEYGIFQ